MARSALPGTVGRMAKSKTRKKSTPSPDSVLAGLVRELEWLRDARSDDSVSEDEWVRRSRAAMMRGSRLPATHRPAFEQQFLLLQQLEAAEQLEAGLAAAQASAPTPAPAVADELPGDSVEDGLQDGSAPGDAEPAPVGEGDPSSPA